MSSGYYGVTAIVPPSGNGACGPPPAQAPRLNTVRKLRGVRTRVLVNEVSVCGSMDRATAA